jgi:hypothetical protein
LFHLKNKRWYGGILDWLWRKLHFLMIARLITSEAPPAKEPYDRRRKRSSSENIEHIEVEIPTYNSMFHQPVVTATTSKVVTFTASLPVEFISSADGYNAEKKTNETKSEDSETRMKN